MRALCCDSLHSVSPAPPAPIDIDIDGAGSRLTLELLNAYTQESSASET